MPDDMDENGPEVSDHMSENEDESENYNQDDGKMANPDSANGSGEVKKKYDPKDPLRPRRKKARRACFACQRAHLTCGDERPCKRCIKRGLAEACQDGVRKKAKYLHDAPPEALGPVLGPNFNRNGASTRPNGHRQDSNASDHTTATTPGAAPFFSPAGAPATFPVYPPGNQPPMAMNDPMSFNPQASPVSPSFQPPPANPQAQLNNLPIAPAMDFNALFDPSNPALYNFDLEGLNFGSQYAGWEFGILNKMGLGAETPPRENSLSRTPTTEASYAAMFGSNNPAFDPSGVLPGDYAAGLDQKNSMYTQGNLQHGLPHAYAIAAGPSSLASPGTDATSSPQILDGSPKPGAFGNITTVSAPPRPKQKQKTNQTLLGKRQRDSASIYESVKEPYPYTAGFHTLISVLRKRFPLNKLLKIARALGEIRPSFISCTKDLTREDLIFMEKCFQRTLVEYNDFLQHCCAPTIVCRRTGEVAAVNKEFTALTGWTKEVLLGQEPNASVASASSEAADADEEARNDNRPKTSLGENGTTRPQAVFLAELMDDDSVVEFYRDFAQLAFEDSRGKVQRSCRLMKYRTKDSFDVKGPSPHKEARTGILSNRVTKIESEHGISRIEKDGKVDCTYCWTIKRDVFDIPMMIIVNVFHQFLPRYYPNQEPHQLAV
ncbi:Transcription activator of gluconeogenesis [Paramyrothecium foliicola]|nr:Transcription activator of gluconeogenesis [Paramyrothecium foliicola]